MNRDALSHSKPEIGFVLGSLPRHRFLHFDISGFHSKIMGADVSQIVARRDPWPARFLHTPQVGGLQTQTVIEEFTKDRVLSVTAFDAMMSLHLALRLNLRFSHTGLLLPYLSLHFVC